MPLDTYGDVILTRDVPEHGVRTGDVGTVVERHVVPVVSEEGYSVEFFDMAGNTVAVVRCRECLPRPTPMARRIGQPFERSRPEPLRLTPPAAGRPPPGATGRAGSNSRNWGRHFQPFD